MRRPERVLVLSLLLVAPLLLTCWVHGDGIGYAALLRSMVVDRDLALGDEFEHFSTHITADAEGLPARLLAKSAHTPGVDPVFQRPRPDPVTGRIAAIYSVGPAIAWAPAYLVAHVVTRLGGGHADGYGGLYVVAIALTSLVAGVIGLVLAMRLAAPVSSHALAAALTITLASPLFYYLYLAPSYGHALSVLTCTAFLLHGWRTRNLHTPSIWLQRGLLAGAMFLVRWSDLVLALPVVALETVRLLRAGRGTRTVVLCLAAALFGALAVALPQLLTWQLFHGRPWVRHPDGYAGFHPEGLLGTLVSARHGLFVWTPITALAVLGLIRLARRNAEMAWLGLAGLALLALANCMVTDWWGGSAFGMRRLIGATPILVVGLAALLEDVGRARAPGVAPSPSRLSPASLAVLGLFVVWNVLLVAQYSLGLIPHDQPVSFATLAANQPRTIARLLAVVPGVLH